MLSKRIQSHTPFSEALCLLVKYVDLLVDEAVTEKKKELSKVHSILSLTLTFFCSTVYCREEIFC